MTEKKIPKQGRNLTYTDTAILVEIIGMSFSTPVLQEEPRFDI